MKKVVPKPSYCRRSGSGSAEGGGTNAARVVGTEADATELLLVATLIELASHPKEDGQDIGLQSTLVQILGRTL